MSTVTITIEDADITLALAGLCEAAYELRYRADDERNDEVVQELIETADMYDAAGTRLHAAYHEAKGAAA